jgi:hypothetical protein
MDVKRRAYGNETIEGLGQLVADMGRERVERRPARLGWTWQFSLLRGLTYGPIPVSHILILVIALRFYV